MIEAKLYFGLFDKDRKRITDLEFHKFIENTIVPRFKSFTILDAKGYYKGDFEPCKVIIILLKDNEKQNAKLQKIAKEYKKMFNQSSVLLSINPINCELV